uniref:SFRICE_039532 n=1 Tax=Spodoptera frugiperda TaxID=7108 RepID=A0A2H1W3Z2_SPOFR
MIKCITFTWCGGGPNKPAINFQSVRGGPFEPANTVMSYHVPHRRKVLTFRVRTSWKSRGGPIMGDPHQCVAGLLSLPIL